MRCCAGLAVVLEDTPATKYNFPAKRAAPPYEERSSTHADRARDNYPAAITQPRYTGDLTGTMPRPLSFTGMLPKAKSIDTFDPASRFTDVAARRTLPLARQSPRTTSASSTRARITSAALPPATLLRPLSAVTALSTLSEEVLEGVGGLALQNCKPGHFAWGGGILSGRLSPSATFQETLTGHAPT